MNKESDALGEPELAPCLGQQLDQVAHDWMRQHCPELYQWLAAQVWAGRDCTEIMASCEQQPLLSAELCMRLEATLSHLMQGRARQEPHPYEPL